MEAEVAPKPRMARGPRAPRPLPPQRRAPCPYLRHALILQYGAKAALFEGVCSEREHVEEVDRAVRAAELGKWGGEREVAVNGHHH